jgi:Winged helix DNA-binding domain
MSTRALSDRQARLLRLRSQRLDPGRGRPAGAVEAVRELCGVHAQLPSSSALTLRPRTTGLDAAAVEEARVDRRALVRTWVMRGTFHLIATEDAGWLLPLLAPVVVAGTRRRHAQLGLDDDTYAKALGIMRLALAGGPLTRAELGERLRRGGVDPAGQRIAALVQRAGIEGVLCHGPDRGAEPTLVLLRDWAGDRLGPSLDRDAALAALARRYLVAYGPAGPADLAAWSGIPVREARSAVGGIAGELVEMVVAGEPAWLPASRAGWLDEPAPGEPLVHLLPGFDVYLLGYRDRSLAVPAEHARRVWTGGGFIKPTLTVDGWAVGIWRSERRGRRVELTVEPFSPVEGRLRDRVENEAADLGRFLGARVDMRLQPRGPDRHDR